MTSSSPSASPRNADAPSSTIPPTNYISLGAEVFGQVQRILGRDRVRGLRIKMGNKVVKEVSVGPMTTAATLGLVVLAVVISTMSIEVAHEAVTGAASEAAK